jgi:hypothetical protein
MAQRSWMPAVLVTAALAMQTAPLVHAARLESASLAGWTAYVHATERRLTRELADGRRFLGIDFDSDAASERAAVLGGQVLVRRLEVPGADGGPIDVPSARVHHWRGAVFVPGVTLADLLAELRRNAPPAGQDDVLVSRVLERGPDRMKVYLKLQRRKIVTVVLDTEHVVTFNTYGLARASTVSVATKIAELENPGTPEERERPQGDDRGFLWKLNAYWRYEQVAGGVIAECESISLSRDAPAVVRYVVEPLIESTAREAMDRTLTSFRMRFAPKTRS